MRLANAAQIGTSHGGGIITFTEACDERYKPRERLGCFPRFYHARMTARIYIYRGAFKHRTLAAVAISAWLPMYRGHGSNLNSDSFKRDFYFFRHRSSRFEPLRSFTMTSRVQPVKMYLRLHWLRFKSRDAFRRKQYPTTLKSKNQIELEISNSRLI